ncbi:MAG: hypothetical protein EOR13_17710 [Mesorhizobium sp.]|nr:MAG: hypothetical protein EOR13_17710 [Mesorhizobium sp.]
MGEFSWRFLLWFSVLLLALVFFTVMSVTLTIRAHAEPSEGPPLSPPIVHITDDPGGSVSEYYKRYKAYSDAGTEVHIHGMCASSCSILLFSSFTGIRACADEGAIFGFHKPFTQQNGNVDRTKSARRATRKLWAAWLEELPNPLRRYLQGVRVPSATEGDEQNTMLIIPASLLLPRCATTVAAQ